MKFTLAAAALLSLTEIGNEVSGFSSRPFAGSKVSNQKSFLTLDGAFHLSSSSSNPALKRGTASHHLPHEQTLKAERRFSDTSSTVHVDSTNGIISSLTGHLLSEDSMASEILSLDIARNSIQSYLQQYKGQTGASIIYSKLLEYGVEVVNGYSGGANLPLLDQFHPDHPRHRTKQPNGKPSKRIRWITNSNENSAGHIAEGYAKSAPPNPVDGKQPAGVVIATSGPGVTNLITPLQDAICDGVPLVFLCGQAATTAPADAFQSAPAVELTAPCTKFSYQIKSAAELPFALDYAFFLSRHGRPGPVYIDLPKDLQNQILDDSLMNKFLSSIPVKNRQGDLILDHPGNSKDDQSTSGVTKPMSGIARFIPRYTGINGSAMITEHVLHLGHDDRGILFGVTDDYKSIQQVSDTSLVGDKESIYQKDHSPSDTIFYDHTEMGVETGALDENSDMTEKVFELIVQAKKPLIIAGQGCNSCTEELMEFAETLQIPVTTTLHALGCFDERHSLALNMVGMHGHPTPNFMTQESDLILCIGSRFDDRITGKMSEYIPIAKEAALQQRGGVIHVDIRISEKAKQVKPTFFVHSTAKKFLQTMNRKCQFKINEFTAPDSSLNRKRKMESWLERKAFLQESYPVNIPCFPKDIVKGRNELGQEIFERRTLMSAQSVVAELNSQLLDRGVMDDCLFSTGVGIHQMVSAQLITWTQPRQMITSGSLGTMGVALGFVIGCKLANGKKICIAGKS